MFGTRILLLIPHPDDEVVGCAAAIQRAISLGARVYAISLTDGVPAIPGLLPWRRNTRSDRVEARLAEADISARALGLEWVERQMIPTRTLRLQMRRSISLIEGAVARYGVDTIWTPAYEGGHQDHDITNFLASSLSVDAPVWEFAEYNYAARRIRPQEFISMYGGEQVHRLSAPETERKRQLLGVYRSERGNLKHVGVVQESFRPLPVHDYSLPPHPGPLFYQRYQWAAWHPRVDGTLPEEICRAASTFKVA